MILETQPLMEEAKYTKTRKNPIYIILCDSPTFMSKRIKMFTGHEFNHACISFNPELDPMYSFGTKKNEEGIGFVVNDPHHDTFYKKFLTKFNVYVMYISDTAYKAVQKRLQFFIDNADRMKYDFLALPQMFFGRKTEHHQDKWFCSRFVMELVNIGSKLQKVPSLWKPGDVPEELTNISLVNRGFDMANYNPEITKRNCNRIVKGTYNPKDVVYEQDSLNENISASTEKDMASKPDMKLSDYSRMKLNDMVVQVYKSQYGSLRHLRINRHTKGFVWLDNKDLVAVINTEEKDDDYKWITAFEIFGQYKGHGLAKQIMQVAMKELGATNLSVRKTNDIAIKVYKSCGFKKYKEDDHMLYMTTSKFDDVKESAVTEAKDTKSLDPLYDLYQTMRGSKYLMQNYYATALLSKKPTDRSSGAHWMYTIQQEKELKKHYKNVQNYLIQLLDDINTHHTITTVKIGGKYYYIECAWKEHQGIYEAKNVESILSLVSKWLQQEKDKSYFAQFKYPVVVYSYGGKDGIKYDGMQAVNYISSNGKQLNNFKPTSKAADTVKKLAEPVADPYDTDTAINKYILGLEGVNITATPTTALKEAAKDAAELLKKAISSGRKFESVYEHDIIPYLGDDAYAILEWNIFDKGIDDPDKFTKHTDTLFKHCQYKFNDTHPGFTLNQSNECFYVSKK